MANVKKKLSLRAMLQDIKERRHLTDEEIGVAADLPDVKKGQAVQTARTVNDTISFRLADWVLNETYANTDPFLRAELAMQEAGFKKSEIKTIQELWSHFLETRIAPADEVAEFLVYVHATDLKLSEELFVLEFWRWKFKVKNEASAKPPSESFALQLSRQELEELQAAMAAWLSGSTRFATPESKRAIDLAKRIDHAIAPPTSPKHADTEPTILETASLGQSHPGTHARQSPAPRHRSDAQSSSAQPPPQKLKRKSTT